jgi:hypothetical protein
MRKCHEKIWKCTTCAMKIINIFSNKLSSCHPNGIFHSGPWLLVRILNARIWLGQTLNARIWLVQIWLVQILNAQIWLVQIWLVQIWLVQTWNVWIWLVRIWNFRIWNVGNLICPTLTCPNVYWMQHSDITASPWANVPNTMFFFYEDRWHRSPYFIKILLYIGISIVSTWTRQWKWLPRFTALFYPTFFKPMSFTSKGIRDGLFTENTSRYNWPR